MNGGLANFGNPTAPYLRQGLNLAEIAAAGPAAQAAARANIGAGGGSSDLADSAIVRQTSPWLYFDGFTAGGRAYCALGAAGALSGKVRTLIGKVYVPTTAECAGKSWVFYNLGSSNVDAAAVSGDGWSVVLNTGGGNLFVRQYGPTVGDIKRWNSTARMDTSFGGRTVWIAIVQAPGVDPVVYVDGVPFAGANAGDVGAPNPWGTHSCAFLRIGGAGGSHQARYEISAPYLLNRSLTAAQILSQSIRGRLPDSDEIGTGSMVAQSLVTWANAGGAYSYETLDGISATGFHAIESAGGYGEANSDIVSIKPGWQYKMTYDLAIASGPAPFWTAKGGGSDAVQLTAGVGQEVFFTSLGTYTQWAIYNAFNCEFTISNIAIIPVGPIARHKILSGAIIMPDSSENRLPLVLTPGALAVGDLPDQIELQGGPMTADGFILLDQIIVPLNYELAAAYVLQAGVGINTITIRETSSGGLSVAAGAMSATIKRVSLALTAGNTHQAAGKKLHLANSSWGGNTVTPFLVFRRAY